MDMEKVPYIALEASQARFERIIHRLILAIILVTVLLFVSNAIWIYEWMSYDYVTETEEVTVDSEDFGNANYIKGGGSIINGKG